MAGCAGSVGVECALVKNKWKKKGNSSIKHTFICRDMPHLLRTRYEIYSSKCFTKAEQLTVHK